MQKLNTGTVIIPASGVAETLTFQADVTAADAAGTLAILRLREGAARDAIA